MPADTNISDVNALKATIFDILVQMEALQQRMTELQGEKEAKILALRDLLNPPAET